MTTKFADPDRADRHGLTGIYVRAIPLGMGRFVWVNADIAELTAESLLQWLHEDGQCNPLAENCIGIMLGHGHICVPEPAGEADDAGCCQ